jgi:hypothetical protein
MASVVLALQVVVVVVALQGVALLLGFFWLERRLKLVTEEISWRDRDQVQPLARALSSLESTVRGGRAESASYLEAVFTGVRGISRNLDLLRAITAQTLAHAQWRAEHGGAQPGELVRLREVAGGKKG